MTNTKITSIAKNYADSLIKLGESGTLDYKEIFENLNTVTDILENSPDLVFVIENPSVPDIKKYELIDAIFVNQVNSYIKNFIKILIEKRRFKEFKGITAAYFEKFDEINNLKRVEIISATDLNEEIKNKITDKLNKKLNKNISAVWHTDKDIIAGLVIKVDDNVIDTSLKNKLENLNKNMLT